ncbi:MAG: LysM peptidoglycan-binding domain-containing protein [Granulosicoccus sp.]|nr:LysM peptidoglycan-binding domain-containing protein [Granulosicoccus sp.]
MSIKKQIISRLAIGGALALSLSACTISPVNPDSRVGKATEKLSAAGSSFLEKTRHVFRLDGTDAYNGKPAVAANDTTDEFQNEVDLALIDQQQDGALVADDGQLVVLSPVADNDGVVNTTPVVTEITPVTAVVEQPAAEELVITETVSTETVIDEQPAVAATPLADYEHIVADNEILWDLSKRLTGDATNWRVLAELNNLGPQGTVYPGMKLVVPADMLKDRSELPVLTEALKPSEKDIVVSSADASTDRITIPKADAVEAVTEVIVADTSAIDVPKTGFGVQAGETMWDLAKRTTGDATNWKAIAAANGMTEKEATFIKYGETIDVPNALLKSSDNTVTAMAAESEATPQAETPVIAAATAAQPEPVEEIVVESAALPAPSEDELKIIPTTFKSEPPVVNEIAVAGSEAAVDQGQGQGQGEIIMVSGTYYPKAVYNDANFSASLLMRVSPGTELEVIKAIGPWYEVKTEQGIGFVHSRDIK